MRDAEAEIVRASITSTLQCAKLPRHSNISKEKLIALKTSANDSIVTVLLTDRRRALVVMDNKEYNDKIEDLIQDTDIYLKITDRRRNPIIQQIKILEATSKNN